MLSEWTGAARVRISGGRGAAIERTLWPTPYSAELVAEDVAHAGRGVRVEIDVAGLPEPAIAALETGMARFARRGVPVTWTGWPRNEERDDRPEPARP